MVCPHWMSRVTSTQMSQDEPCDTDDVGASSEQPAPSPGSAAATTPTWLWMTIIFALLAVAMGVNNAYERGDALAAWIIAFPVIGLALALWAWRRDLTEQASRYIGTLAQLAAFTGIGLAAWSTSPSSGWANYFVLVLIGLAGAVLWFLVKLLRLPAITRSQ